MLAHTKQAGRVGAEDSAEPGSGGNGAARRAEQMARPGRGQTMILAARGIGAVLGAEIVSL